MKEIETYFVMAVFEDQAQTNAALEDIKRQKLEGLRAAVAVQKDSQGNIKYQDIGLTPAKGAAGGVVLGAVVGILSGGAGLALGALGAVLGGLVGKRKREGRLPSDRINHIVAQMPPKSSVILMVVDSNELEKIEHTFEMYDGEILTAEITAELIQQLDEHQESIYQVLTKHLEGSSEDPSG